MNMTVHPTGRHDHALGCNDLSGRANYNRHTRLNIRIAGFTDPRDATIFNPDIGLYDAPVIDDQSIGQHGVNAVRAHPLRLSHAVTDHFATAKLDLLAVNRKVLFYARKKSGVGQANAIACGRTKHFRIRLSRNFH